MAKKITLRNDTATNTGKGAKMTHAEMDANLESFFISSSLDGNVLKLYSTGSANVDSIDLSAIISSAPSSPGAQGTQGVQGTTGVGTQGTDGIQGTQGIAGGAASQGIQGIQGLEGIQGLDGAQGTAGAGAQGTDGVQGAQGTDGIGSQGTQGIAGSAASQGVQGIQGEQGIQGPAAEGSQGTAIAPFAFASVNTTNNGSGINISWSNWDSQNSTLDFTFTTPQANTDYTVVTDSEVFDNYFVGISNKTVNGFTAEFYDDTQSRTPSTFAEFTFLVYASTPLVQTGVGAQGITGAQGLLGLQGTQGIQGEQGLQGTQGIQGLQGIQGTQGIQGLDGLQGTTGTAGSTSGRIYYFNQSITNVSSYSQLGTQPTTSAETDTAVISTANGDTKIKDFISDAFDFTVIPGGVQRFFLWMTKENQNDHIETYVVLKVTDNAGNVIATAGTSQAVDVTWNNNNTTPSLVNVDITFPTTSVSIGQRMLVEVWARNNENQDNVVTLYTEGASHYSYVVTSVGATSGVTGAQGTQGIQGTQGTQGIQGIQGLEGPVTADYYDIVYRSFSGPGYDVVPKVIAGTSQIVANTASTTISISEIGGLTLGEQVHITATLLGVNNISRVISINTPAGFQGSPVTLNAAGQVIFQLDQGVDNNTFFMYHVWYTPTAFPG